MHLIAGGFEATGVTQFLGITAAASLLAYQAHPFLLQGVASAWDFSQVGCQGWAAAPQLPSPLGTRG